MRANFLPDDHSLYALTHGIRAVGDSPFCPPSAQHRCPQENGAAYLVDNAAQTPRYLAKVVACMAGQIHRLPSLPALAKLIAFTAAARTANCRSGSLEEKASAPGSDHQDGLYTMNFALQVGSIAETVTITANHSCQLVERRSEGIFVAHVAQISGGNAQANAINSTDLVWSRLVVCQEIGGSNVLAQRSSFPSANWS